MGCTLYVGENISEETRIHISIHLYPDIYINLTKQAEKNETVYFNSTFEEIHSAIVENNVP